MNDFDKGIADIIRKLNTEVECLTTAIDAAYKEEYYKMVASLEAARGHVRDAINAADPLLMHEVGFLVDALDIDLGEPNDP